MNPTVSLIFNQDGTYDLILNYERNGVEFSKEFDLKKEAHKISKSIFSNIKNVKIKSVKILVSGVIVTTLAFSTFLSALAASDRYTMGYLYSGTDHQQIEYINQTNNALDVVSPSYFDLREDGSLKLNYLSPFFIKSMHDKGIKVVPFLSNHWNRTAGINALKNIESLSTQIADYVEEYDLDGINVDIENVTHEQKDQYTQFVKLLREKIPGHKEISVAVAANPNNWQTGWHGSYDYAALSEYADHLLIMAYDEHYEGSSPGPVASISFVERSIQYALEKTTSDKIVVGIPFYGRIWGLDSNRITGKGVSAKTIQEIIERCESTLTYDEQSQSVKAEVTITESSGNFTVGGDFVLQPGRYVIWFENAQSYQAKLGLIEKYNLKGAGAWSLGQEDPSIWEHYEDWINGENINTDAVPPASSEPGQTLPPTTGNPDSAPTEGEFAQAWVKLDTEQASVYKNPNLKGKVIATLAGVTAVSVREHAKGIHQIQLSNGEIGYLSSDYLSFQAPIPEAAPPSQEYFIYEVKAGDTLWKIAEQFLGEGKRYPEIVQLNNLSSDDITPGMRLKIPGAESTSKPEMSFVEYTVKRGDSLWKIAKSKLGSGSRYPEIMELNNLENEVIYPGQILKLPN